MTQSLHESFGGLSLPVSEDDVDKTLAPLDPGRDMLLSLFAAAINAELGAAYRKVVEEFASGHDIDRTNPVADTFAGAPTPAVMQERKAVFPLLALHRSGTHTFETHLLDQDKLRQPWELHYILGPLDVADSRKILDLCVAASKIVRRTVTRGGHPAYQSGASVFFPAEGEPTAFGEITVTGGEGPGQAVFAGDANGTPYYAITINLETVEFVDAGEATQTSAPFEGADYDVGIGGEPAGILNGALYANSNFPGS